MKANCMTITLAVDAMGGDKAPGIIIQGMHVTVRRYPSLHFLLYGDSELIEPLLARKNIGRYIGHFCAVYGQDYA